MRKERDEKKSSHNFFIGAIVLLRLRGVIWTTKI
jgi:hypothetical protein